jgi:hypothetical protein
LPPRLITQQLLEFTYNKHIQGENNKNSCPGKHTAVDRSLTIVTESIYTVKTEYLAFNHEFEIFLQNGYQKQSSMKFESKRSYPEICMMNRMDH